MKLRIPKRLAEIKYGFKGMGKNLFKGDELMSKKQTLDAKLQSEIDNMKEALNSTSGFKNAMSAGTQGTGASISKNQR